MADRIAQALTAMAVLLLAAAVFLAGLGFLAVAAQGWLATQLPGYAATAVVGAGLIVLTFLMLLVARSAAQPGAKPTRRTAAETPDAAPAGDDRLAAAARLGEQLGPLVRRHWKATGASAFAFGLILGASPRARRALIDAVREQL
jgi:hypothetical protein